MSERIELSGAPPVVEPGQVWLIEQIPAAPPFACDRGALDEFDLVLYDPALAPALLLLLPGGAYAEPLPRDAAGAENPLSRRAVALAADGWRVAQLVAVGADCHTGLRAAPTALAPLGGNGDLPVRIIAKTRPDRRRQWDARLASLPRLVAELAQEDLLTLVLGPFAAGHSARHYAVAANALAG